MSEHGRKAIELFEDGYNCAQSILAAFSDETGLGFEESLRLASSFGGGMGRLREVCGAVSGMFLVVGAKYGYTDPHDKRAKDEQYRLIQELAKKFEEAEGTIICRDLLGLPYRRDNPESDPRSLHYYHTRPCAAYVEQAAVIMDGYIASRKETGSHE